MRQERERERERGGMCGCEFERLRRIQKDKIDILKGRETKWREAYWEQRIEKQGSVCVCVRQREREWEKEW